MRERIEAFTDKECGSGASPEQVRQAEVSLGVSLPSSYRHFLERFGWGRFSCEQLYGLGTDVPIHLDLVRNTRAERETMVPALPTCLIPVMNDGAGNHFCLDTSQTAEGECPLVFWDHELGPAQVAQAVANSFAVWLVTLLDRLQRV
jgi:cell wall assembly regulator SMI1